MSKKTYDNKPVAAVRREERKNKAKQRSIWN